MAGLEKLWPFKPPRAREDAERLVARVTQISRQPSFFGEGRVPDTLAGRLEVVTLNASLAFLRLRQDSALEPLSQHFADVLFSSFDAGLREAGVGDTAVPKRMRRIAADFYGRLNAYANALAKGDAAALERALSRNVLGAENAPFAVALSAYARANATLQAQAGPDALFRLDGWARAPA